MDLTTSAPVLFAVSAIAVLALIVSFVRKLRAVRAFYKDVPCPPHDFLFGHLKIIGETMRELPPNFHYQQLLAYIGHKYDMPTVFYLDMWPASSQFMIVQDANVAAQVTQTHSLPKHSVNRRFLGPLTGSKSIVTVEGQEWKLIRSIINPGFAPQYVNSLVPLMNRHVTKFRDKLQRLADNGDKFPMLDLLTSLTFDFICEVILGADLDSQRKPNDLAYHFGRAVKLSLPSDSTIAFARAAIPRWWHCMHLDRIITKLIKERHARTNKDPKSRAQIDLFLQAYEEEKFGGTKDSSSSIDPAFMEIAVSNVKSLIIGGHDTTAITIAYTLALLSQNPPALAKLRNEHEAVLGSDPSEGPSVIASEPSLLKKLPYTEACVKEAMRIFSPASTTRATSSNTIQTVDYRGRTLPIAGQQIWVLHYGIGQQAEYWPNPHEYIPERFMPDAPHPQVKDAWRGFEKGPRGCVGQELAMNEIKMVLITVVREFDFEVAYEKDAPRAPEGWGGPMYQVVEFAAKPTLHMPMKVRKRSNHKSHIRDR